MSVTTAIPPVTYVMRDAAAVVWRKTRYQTNGAVPAAATAAPRAIAPSIVTASMAAVGVASMTLIDHDTVGVENLATQAYWPEDMDQPKVQATATLCRRINPLTEVATQPERFRRSMAKEIQVPGRKIVIFCCVDSMTARGLIWESVRQQVDLFIDGRMSAEVMRVLASDHPAQDSHYPSTLFAQDRAYAGSCTAKSTVYTASIAAGLMVSQFTRWLRGLPVDRDITLNLLSAELIAA